MNYIYIKFTSKYKNRAQDFRVNTLPVAGREKMVIRVLAPQMDAKQAKDFAKADEIRKQLIEKGIL